VQFRFKLFNDSARDNDNQPSGAVIFEFCGMTLSPFTCLPAKIKKKAPFDILSEAQQLFVQIRTPLLNLS